MKHSSPEPTTVAARLRSMSLLTKFLLMSAVGISVVGVGLAWRTGAAVRTTALGYAEEMAQIVANTTVQPLLDERAFAEGLASDEVDALADALSRDFRGLPVQRVKIFDREGRILFSDDRELIGTRPPPNSEFRSALAGGVVSELEHGESGSADDHMSLLEVYLPVRYGEATVGVFELYLPFAETEAQIRSDVRTQWLVIAAGLLALFGLLARTVATASSDLRRQLRRNEWLATHDGLTDLPNRTLFADRTAAAVSTARRHGDVVAVLLIDLDRFKEVNDTLGHGVGDQLLRSVAERLQEATRDGDTLARLGGDEFAVLLPRTGSPEAAVEVARRLHDLLLAPFMVDSVLLEVGASIGVACHPQHADGGSALLQRADVAMYAAKEERTDVRLYDPSMDGLSPERLLLYGELRRGIDNDELVLQYQPKVALSTGRVKGVEALVRWQHPTRGVLGPHEFIGIAEQTGLINRLTDRVLDVALRQARDWRAEGLDLAVAVNLSARCLVDADLPDRVAALLARYGVPPDRLELELTETTVMVDPGRALAVLGELDARGVRIAVDDYGTGHSSLAYLRRLPITDLKIDKSFVIGMDADDNDDVIVRSTIELARNLNLRVVAEGVETPAALRRLTALGCDEAQGFHLSRPVPAEDVVGTVRAVEHLVARAAADDDRDVTLPAPA